MRSVRQLLADVVRGLLWGLAFASLYTLYIGVLYLIRGSSPETSAKVLLSVSFLPVRP